MQVAYVPLDMPTDGGKPMMTSCSPRSLFMGQPLSLLSSDADVDLRANPPKYVCRAGLKLEKALDTFAIDVQGLRVLDAGLSTGGFTDCLLQRGVAAVYGVDVGYGQVAERVRTDPRVTVLERTNLRYLTSLPDNAPPVDLVTLDLSFISVLRVMPNISAHLLAPAAGAQLVVLIKPQFESTREEVSKGKGVIHSRAAREDALQRTVAGIEGFGFRCLGTAESPVKGAKGGNTEYLAYFKRTDSAVAHGAGQGLPGASEA